MQSHDKLISLCTTCKAWTYNIRTQFTEFYELYKIQSNKVNNRDGWLVKLKVGSVTAWHGGSAAQILTAISALVERNIIADELWVFTQYGKLLYVIDVSKLHNFLRQSPIKPVAIIHDPNQQHIGFSDETQDLAQDQKSASNHDARITPGNPSSKQTDATGCGINAQGQPNALRPMGDGQTPPGP